MTYCTSPPCAAFGAVWDLAAAAVLAAPETTRWEPWGLGAAAARGAGGALAGAAFAAGAGPLGERTAAPPPPIFL